MTRSFSKRLDAQFKKVLRDNNQYFTCTMDTEDIKIWYVLVKNLPDPYVDGEYIFRLNIPNNFPDNPPSLMAKTPNGVMEIDGKVCVSVGEFHQNDHYKTNSKDGQYGWVPSLGISGFILQGIVNGMISFTDEDEGIRLKNLPDRDKKKLAQQSKEYNLKHHPQIMELLNIHQECFPDLTIYKQNGTGS